MESAWLIEHNRMHAAPVPLGPSSHANSTHLFSSHACHFLHARHITCTRRRHRLGCCRRALVRGCRHRLLGLLVRCRGCRKQRRRRFLTRCQRLLKHRRGCWSSFRCRLLMSRCGCWKQCNRLSGTPRIETESEQK